MAEISTTPMQNRNQPAASELSEAKRRLLQQYLSGRPASNGGGGGVVRRRLSAQPSPLSFAQQQVWLHGQMTGDIPFYNETLTIYRQGPLDVAVLQKCLLEITRHHEIWRTTFDSVAGEPVQVVHSTPLAVPLSVMDLRQLPEGERAMVAERLATVDARHPFDLQTGPLLRALLVRMDDEQHRLYMTIHQIVFDAVTAYRVLLPQLATLYEAFASSKPSPLPGPHLQYSDFAEWQRQQPTSEAWFKHLAYWRKQLAGDLPVLQWPNDRPRPPLETHCGAIQRFTLEANLVGKLKEFCHQQGASSYMVLLAGLAALLYRYTGQEDIILGSFTAGRKLAELESLMGYFVNPLPLRIDLSGNPTFRELLPRVRGVVLDALAHEDAPFVEILREIQYRPDPRRNPLFQVALSQQPKLPPLPTGWNLATEEICNGGSKLDLMIVVDNRDDNIFGPVTYNPDLYQSSTIERMLEHWQTLLTAAVTHPQKCIAHLPLLGEVERDQILLGWNDTRDNNPRAASLPALIEAQVERTPNATALVCDRDQLSYQELNTRANQLARHLRNLGVGQETLVGICMDRCLDMVIALLGVLKAGGAYVPLDPAYPKDRLAFMIEDSGLRFLISKSVSEFNLAQFGGNLVCLDRDWPAISRESKTNPAVEIRQENLAYVIYTSGSTGRPKGVQICHQALVNLLTSMQHRPGLTHQDRLLAVTTISFDIAALELYLPLIVGGCCVLASREVAADGHRLSGMLEEYEITAMQATPSTWKLLLESGWKGKEDLKVLCGGEALSPELAGRLVTGTSSVWNMYGPTETTVWSALHPVMSAQEPVLIGRPIANTEMYILDRYLQPVPSGVTGELYIGGDGLARGYLDRPQLNLEKFIPNPYRPGARFYRTGDLARYQQDGNIECLGRVDNQVKVRGFRIELGEIESVLREHPAVEDACVTLHEEVADDRRLLAYLILKEEEHSTLDELRHFLKQKLPSYMVPYLIVLDRFPLTPNGKLDRHALPPPNSAETRAEQSSGALRDPIEQLLATLWKDLLKLDQVSLYDNFFDLGGHSLLATQMVARLEKELGVRMKAKELAFQTLGQVAESCRARLQTV